ncbi:MAG: hypothetical protein ACPGNT_11795 [Rhodospirillales bacterium]
MILFFFTGIVLLVAAFIGAAMEAVAPLPPESRSLLNPGSEVWPALWPQSFLALEGVIGSVSPVLWDPVAITLLKLPLWMLAGIPGFYLALRFRPAVLLRHDDDGPEEDDLFLFDRLAQRAREEGFHDGDDMHPDERPSGQGVPEGGEDALEPHQNHHDDMAPEAALVLPSADPEVADDGSDDMAPTNSDEYVPPDDDWSGIEPEFPIPGRKPE